MTILMKQTEVYRVDDEAAAVKMIDDAREQSAITGDYLLKKSSYVLKVKKAKGEVIDSFALVTLEKVFSE